MASKYTDEQKSSVIAAVARGESVRSVAKAYNVSTATVQVWANGARQLASNTANKEELGELVGNYVATSLRTLCTQAGWFGDRETVQDLGERIFPLAQSHRIIGDQVVRVLRSLQPVADA